MLAARLVVPHEVNFVRAVWCAAKRVVRSALGDAQTLDVEGLNFVADFKKAPHLISACLVRQRYFLSSVTAVV